MSELEQSHRKRHRPHKPPAPTPGPVPTPIAPIPTTLSEIIAGKFPSATDKHGTGGTLVQVTGLKVVATQVEGDGDTHITVTDGTVAVFITEITPVEKAKGLADPPVGATITEIGYAFYDTAHAREPWHGNTGWEIHPVVAWK